MISEFICLGHFFRLSRRSVSSVILLSLAFLTASTELWSQPPQGGGGRRSRNQQAPADNAPPEQAVPFQERLAKATPTEIIKVDDPSFVSRDGIRLVGDFRKGTADADTVPVIILHGKDETKETMAPLALALSNKGMAVLTPDLRGHGESTKRMVPDFSTGNIPLPREDNNYKASDFNDAEWAKNFDDGANWFTFLVALHNDKLINIRKLVIIGNQWGGTVASHWAKSDWSVSSDRRGRFTGTLVLISPKEEECAPALKSMRRHPVHCLIFIGNIPAKVLEDAKKIQGFFNGVSREDDKTAPEDQKAVIISVNTERQGTGLLNADALKATERIGEYINLRLGKLRPNEDQWQKVEF